MTSKGGQQSNEEDNSVLSDWGCAALYLCKLEEFWCPSIFTEGVENSQKHFQAKDNDIVVASNPKSGTTWLKALTFAIVNHQRLSSMDENHHPLLTSNSHALVPFLEINLKRNDVDDPILYLSNMTEPRLYSTHIPFPSLPKSMMESNCKIIYICRNPFDTFISTWTFSNQIIRSQALPTLTIEEAFEKYCNGVVAFGPWWSHMLGYWNESIAKPNKVLFLKYEDLKEDINFHVKKIIEFLGCSFTEEDESNEVIESIIKLCSFDKMKDLEVNKFGKPPKLIENKYLFRKGEVGDWVNYFSPAMVEKLSKIIEEKLSGSGLSFKMYS